MRFHQAVAFLEMDQVLPIAKATDELGYAGIYISDHLFNAKNLESRYTYSTADDGSPFWEKETAWPDPMCLISAMAAVTTSTLFTTGVYLAPLRDLISAVKTVGTAAVISENRIRLGVGVGWCKEEFEQTGQEFTNRGKRLDEMIPAMRALLAGGWVEYHGTYYDVPECQINPSPSQPVPILGGGHSAPAFRRAAQHCDGWIAAGAYSEQEAWDHLSTLKSALKDAGREHDDFLIYLSLMEIPSVDLYRRFEDAGVTDIVCAPWMMVDEATPIEELAARRFDALAEFASTIIDAMR